MQRAAVVAVALCSSLWWCQPSYAGVITDKSTPTLLTTSGAWGASASSTSFTFTSSTQRFFFSASNVGTLSLRGTTYTMSVTGLRNATFWILACVGGTWNVTTGACTGGTQQTIGGTTGAATSATTNVAGTYPAASLSSVSLQAFVDKNSPKAVATISISVDRTLVRAAVTTNA
jgi:hypothetical protein